jgi:hypothetical protein
MTAKNREPKEAAMTTVNITPPAEPEPEAVAETLEAIDSLTALTVCLTLEAARLRLELSDLRAEQKLREAMVALSIEGRSESERQARLKVALSADADYRTLLQAERDARLKLAETEGKLWATRMKTHACLALLKLAATSAEAGGEGETEGGEEDAP